jgi:transposase
MRPTRSGVASLRDLIEIYDRKVAMLEREIHRWLRYDAGYHSIPVIDGVGTTMAAIFVAEIGDVSRFPTPQRLCSWAGLTPKHIESDRHVIRSDMTRGPRSTYARIQQGALLSRLLARLSEKAAA